MNSGGRIIKNLFHLVSGEVVSSALAFVITVWLARKLGTEGYGYWALAQAVLVYPVLLTDLGLSTFGLVEMAKSRNLAGRLVADIVSVRFVLAAILYAISVVVVLVIPLDSEIRMLFVGAFLWLFVQALNPEFAFQGIEKMWGVAAWRASNHLLYLILLLAFVSSREHLTDVPMYRFAGALFPAVVLLLLLHRQVRWIGRIGLNLPRIKSYLKTSVIMAGSVIVIKLYYTFDSIMLGIMDSADSVGVYNAAYKVVLLFIGLASLIQVAFAPTISRQAHDSALLDRTILRYGLLLTLCGSLFFGATSLMRTEIVDVLYGHAYAGSSSLLFLLSLSGFMVFIGTTFQSPLLYGNRHRQYLVTVSVGAAANVVLNLLLIPDYGANGAALATIASNFIIYLMAAAFYSKTGSVWLFFRSLWLALLFALFLLIFSYIPLGSIAVTILFVLTFTGSCYLLYRKEFVSAIELLLRTKKREEEK